HVRERHGTRWYMPGQPWNWLRQATGCVSLPQERGSTRSGAGGDSYQGQRLQAARTVGRALVWRKLATRQSQAVVHAELIGHDDPGRQPGKTGFVRRQSALGMIQPEL